VQTGLHAIGWGLQRMGVTLGILVFGAAFALVMWVVVIIVGQAIAQWGQ
jgi:hypothetical protein